MHLDETGWHSVHDKAAALEHSFLGSGVSGFFRNRFGQHVDGSRDEPEMGGRTHFTVQLARDLWKFFCIIKVIICSTVATLR